MLWRRGGWRRRRREGHIRQVNQMRTGEEDNQKAKNKSTDNDNAATAIYNKIEE